MPNLHTCLASAALIMLVGCSSTTTSNTSRSGTEQLLVSNAIDQTLNKVDFSVFAGHKVYLEEKYLEAVDKPYIVGSLRHRLLQNGAQLVSAADKSQIVIEPRSGGVGTHSASTFVGVPEIVLPGMLTLPETRLIEKKNQKGIAKIGLVAYETETGRSLGSGGLALSESDDSNWYFVGIGPYQNGSIREEVKQAKKQRPAKTSSRPNYSSTVAFSEPVGTLNSLHKPGQVRLTAGEEETKEVPAKNASADKNSSPEWVR
ncbi:hypothetical protein GYB59_07975 [bacterium]|nr:hypothetical protein [bacterium]